MDPSLVDDDVGRAQGDSNEDLIPGATSGRDSSSPALPYADGLEDVRSQRYINDMLERLEILKGKLLATLVVPLGSSSEGRSSESEVPLPSSPKASPSFENGGDLSPATPDEERTFASIRDDLMFLAEGWESALRLMRYDRLGEQAAADDQNGREEEQAQVEPLKTHTLDDMDDEVEVPSGKTIEWTSEPAGRDWASKAADTGSPDDAEDLPEDGKIEGSLDRLTGLDDDELSQLLMRATSPRDLPQPGIEEVFEADLSRGNGPDRPRSKLSREERIKLMREKRENNSAAQEDQRRDPRVASDGVMLELRNVMDSRKAQMLGKARAQDPG